MRLLLMLAVLCLIPGQLHALDVTVDATIRHTNGWIITARTNLPDATKLTVLIYNEQTRYFVQAETAVTGGKIQVGPLRDQEIEMAPGSYISEIMTVPAQLQPASVQGIIGSRGQELQGALVRRGMLGGQVHLRQAYNLM